MENQVKEYVKISTWRYNELLAAWNWSRTKQESCLRIVSGYSEDTYYVVSLETASDLINKDNEREIERLKSFINGYKEDILQLENKVKVMSEGRQNLLAELARYTGKKKNWLQRLFG